MGPEQWLFLQWHEHKGSLVSTFEKLFERNTFVDCTLAAEGQYLNVHKMILSACSPYFEILLNENRDKHPIIILKDVKFRSLKSIIEYMYRGEANVLSTEMTDFLAAAETLQIKGIGKQGGGDTRTQPKNLRDLMEEQSRPPCPTMQIINEEKDNWADSDLSSALTETVQDSFVTQNAVLFSQGDAGATIALPQKLPKAVAPAEAAEEAEAAAAAPGLGSHSEPVRPAAPQADWAGAASAGDAGPLEAAPKAEADAVLPAPAPPPAPRPPPADMEDAETASLGSSVIELSDTTEEWAEEEDMDEGQAAHAHALAPAAEESRARFEAASDVARDSASRDLGSEQAAAAGPVLSPAPTRRASTSTSASASPSASASANASARASACASAASVASAASRTSLTTHAGATTSAGSAASANSATAGRRRRRSGAAPPAPLSAASTRPRQASGLSPRKAPRVSSGAAVGAAPGAGPGATADDLQGALRRASPPKAKRSPGKGAARGKRQQRAFSDAEGCDAESAAAVAAAALGGDAIEDAFAHASSNLKSALRCLRSQCHYYSSPSLAAAASPTPTSASTPTPPTPTPARRQARSYVCPVCSKVFPWLCHLKIHLETHRGEQVYKCEECAYSTTKFSDYLLHQRLHSWRSSHAARQRSHARAAAVASAATAASAASAVAAACPSARLHKCSMWEFGDGAAPVPTAHCASEGNLRLGVYRYRL